MGNNCEMGSRRLFSEPDLYLVSLPTSDGIGPTMFLFTRQHELKMRIRETVRHHPFDAVLINGSDMLWAVNEVFAEMPTIQCRPACAKAGRLHHECDSRA